jgi:hypothetical protein
VDVQLLAAAGVSFPSFDEILGALASFWLEAEDSAVDSGCSAIGWTGDLAVLFFFPIVFTITGFAVTVRATIELLLFASVTPALASCEGVIAGTAGVSGLRFCEDDGVLGPL